MKKELSIYFDSIMNSINAKVAAIDLNSNDTISDSRQMIRFLKGELSKLKDFIMSYTFNSVDEEIDFFKNKKPVILGHLIFFNQVYRIESGCPLFGDAARNYYIDEVERLKVELKKDMEFYRYYRSGSTLYDELYFTRGQEDVNMFTEAFFFETDTGFSTYFDYKVAIIISSEMLFNYLFERMNDKGIKSKRERELHRILQSHYTWTETKAAIVELIYGLFTVGCINNGKAEIADLARIFSLIFNIDMGDFYHAYLALKIKKKSPTAFLEKMMLKLREYMQREED